MRTFYGDEDEPSSPCVCALVGTQQSTRVTKDSEDGPFAVLPEDGVSSNIGPPVENRIRFVLALFGLYSWALALFGICSWALALFKALIVGARLF
jgi:hypothetical protein